jgi:hypothetical protein
LDQWRRRCTDDPAKRVYLNPDATDANRVKAAASALPFERPKVSVSVNVGPALLGRRLDQMKTIEPTVIEHQSSR